MARTERDAKCAIAVRTQCPTRGGGDGMMAWAVPEQAERGGRGETTDMFFLVAA